MPAVIAAARIAEWFHLDPLTVLDTRDPFHRLIRHAALMVCHADEQARRKAASKPT